MKAHSKKVRKNVAKRMLKRVHAPSYMNFYKEGGHYERGMVKAVRINEQGNQEAIIEVKGKCQFPKKKKGGRCVFPNPRFPARNFKRIRTVNERRAASPVY